MIDHLSLWCRKWRMIINRDKTQIVHFRPKTYTLTDHLFMFDNGSLDIVPAYKYLGIHFDQHLTFQTASMTLSSSATRALGALKYKLRSLKECKFSTCSRLYFACICPILDYASAAWSFHQQSNIEQVQYKALRYFFWST